LQLGDHGVDFILSAMGRQFSAQFGTGVFAPGEQGNGFLAQ
jgi:hypothetical protein